MYNTQIQILINLRDGKTVTERVLLKMQSNARNRYQATTLLHDTRYDREGHECSVERNT